MMKILNVAAILTLAGAGICWIPATALADSPSSDAAVTCLQGPQIDFYEVVNPAGDSTANLDFEGVTQGFDDSTSMPYILSLSHGACVSFVAKNSKGSGSDRKAQYIKVVLTEVLITST
jgi:hypothetical protein